MSEPEKIQRAIEVDPDALKANLQAWIERQLSISADMETYLLGNTKVQDWKMQLQYWLGRRDLMWRLQAWLEGQP